MSNSSSPRPLAVLVGVQLPGVSDTEHAADLAELGRLVHTLGYEVAATVSQRRDRLAAGTVLGSGKLAELARLTGGRGTLASRANGRKSKARERWEAEAEEAEEQEAEAASDEEAAEGDELPEDELPGDELEAEASEEPLAERPTVVVVDHELSPSQLSNLEQATGAQVYDRTGVIVDIFHRHARSREAKMQVEIARLNYLAPRLRESTGSRERQQGRGSGDSAVELDRRKIRDRLAELREGLASIQQDQENRRYARRDQLRVALVGYTNAGKSSLMRALTGSEVLVADQLFATLDTTVRALQPETRPRVLISDTVGFIQKLPHDLVASFRSTLDEALEASLLLYVVDGSDPTWESQLEVTRSVLREIGAQSVPSRLLFNKADRLTPEAREALLQRHPEALILSAHAPDDVAALRQTLIEFFEGSMIEAELVIPYARQGRIGEVYEHARVLSEAYDETGRRLKLRALPAAMARLTRAFET
ncbi:GTPase HflX [Archangium sp. Cb G35]|uniref:GTPase HflX n=1 Tax=Archangium sp. Cb G35 TaxID=1920190 RepID=UPI000936EFB5|nr:GTPase HflX [Archangium sp. Cb G35]OJT21103.1 GTPase HflX [Archangium sp. Cb G35]